MPDESLSKGYLIWQLFWYLFYYFADQDQIMMLDCYGTVLKLGVATAVMAKGYIVMAYPPIADSQHQMCEAFYSFDSGSGIILLSLMRIDMKVLIRLRFPGWVKGMAQF